MAEMVCQETNIHVLGNQFLDLVDIPNAPFRVLHFIFARTLRFHKAEEKIPFRHFMRGVYDSEGKCVQSGIPGNSNTIKKSLAKLEQLGIITLRKAGDLGSTFVAVNLDHITSFIEGVKMLREPKQTQKSSDRAKLRPRKCDFQGSETVTKSLRPVTKSLRQPSRIREENIENINRDFVNRETVVAARRDSRNEGRVRGTNQPIRKVISDLHENNEKRRQKVLSAEEELTASSFTKVWNAAVDNYCEATGSHGIQRIKPNPHGGIFMKSLSRSPLGSGWKEYIQDVVENWDQYIDHFQSVFSAVAARKVPAAPMFSYFLRMNAGHFMPYYLKRKSGEITRADAKEAKSARRYKMRLEDAEKEIERLRERVALADRNEAQIREEARQQVRLAVKSLRSASKVESRRHTEEEIAAALDPANELPTWEELQQRRGNQ